MLNSPPKKRANHLINSQPRTTSQTVSNQATNTKNLSKQSSTTQITPPPCADLGIYIYSQNRHINEALTQQQNINIQFDR